MARNAPSIVFAELDRPAMAQTGVKMADIVEYVSRQATLIEFAADNWIRSFRGIKISWRRIYNRHFATAV